MKRITIDVSDAGFLNVVYEVTTESGQLRAVGKAGYADTIADIVGSMLSKMGSDISSEKARNDRTRTGISSGQLSE